MLRLREFERTVAEPDETFRRTAVLHLRPPPSEDELRNAHRRGVRVSWEEGIEEHPGQRVSKCCCVFHKKKLFGESSSDEDDSCSSSDEDEHGVTREAGADGSSQFCCDHQHGDVAKKHSHRPKCTQKHCYCETRFH